LLNGLYADRQSQDFPADSAQRVQAGEPWAAWRPEGLPLKRRGPRGPRHFRSHFGGRRGLCAAGIGLRSESRHLQGRGRQRGRRGGWFRSAAVGALVRKRLVFLLLP
jgi:hypothetical protein